MAVVDFAHDYYYNNPKWVKVGMIELRNIWEKYK